MIVHLRVVPGLGIAVEEQRSPEICSHPVIMGGLPQQRGTVREANLAAQRCGVRAGMPLSQAHQYCPEGLFLVPDLPCYQAVWATICDALRDYTPLVDPVEMGQVACDLSGCERRWPDVTDVMREIAAQVRRVSGIIPRIGVASNRFVAQLASLAGDGDGFTVILPGQEQAFLAELPLTLLPELDPRLALTFQVLGLHTMSQFAALPPAAVKRRFGAVGERLHRYARGIDPRPVVPPASHPAVTARYECEEGSLAEVVIALRQLAQTCITELQERGLAGHLVELTLIPFLSVTDPIGRSADTAVGEDVGVNCIHPLPDCRRVPFRWHDRLSAPVGGERPVVPGQRMNAIHPYVLGYRIGRVEAGRDDRRDEGRDCSSASVRPRPPLSAGDIGVETAADQGREDRDGATVPTPAPGSRLVGHPGTHPRKLRTLVRTPIGASDAAVDAEATLPEVPLLEHAQRLLLRHWPRPADGQEISPWQVQTIELAVSEFAAPAQLSFAEFNRLDQTGGLAGLDPHRRRALEAQAEMLATRYRDTSFRHVASVDPGNILTERRVRWEKGLPWRRPPAKDLKP